MRRADHPEGELSLRGLGPIDLGPPRGRRTLLAHAPAFLVLGAALVLSVFHAGYAETSWYPAALFLLALLVVVLLVAPPVDRRLGPFGWTLIVLGLFVLWTYASLTWALLPGNAWEAANRSLMLWMALALAGQRVWRPRDSLVAVGVVAAGTALIAAGTLAVGFWGDDVAALFLGGRLSEPANYANATAGLLLIGFWPALHLAVARDLPWPLRAGGLAAATLLLMTALLTQSRGGAIALAATAVLFLLAHPRHWPAAAALATSMVLVALSWDPLVAVRSADTVGQLEAGFDEAVRRIAIGTAAAFVAGAVAVLGGRALGRRGVPSEGGRARGDRAFLGLAAVTAVAAVVVLASSTAWLDARWEDFRSSGYSQVDSSGSSRFTGSLGSGRYDFYRVALATFEDRPVLGVGAESFAVPYLQQRRSGEAPRYAHSLLFGVLSQLGAIGGLLLAGFAACAGWGLWRTLRRNPAAGRGVAVAAFAGFAVWFVHGLGDWLWEFPTLSLLALALLAVALRTRPGDPEIEAPGPARAAPPGPVRVALLLGVVAAAVSLALPASAARVRQAGLADQRTDPQAALDQLATAAELNPLTGEALLQRGVIARRLGLEGEARASIAQAVRREPDRWFGQFELGLLAAQDGDRRGALRRLDRAIALNPQQEVLQDARSQVAESRRPIDIDAIENDLYGLQANREQPLE